MINSNMDTNRPQHLNNDIDKMDVYHIGTDQPSSPIRII